MDNSDNIEVLEKFILDNPELDTLEVMLSQFNIFETMNIVNAEVRHSNVLSWLLNPIENHGLGNYFLRKFLKHFISENKSSLENQISLFDLEQLSLYEVEARREWKNIDILIIISEDKNKIAITIENKIKSSEHSDQLRRYRVSTEKEFPDYLRLYIYLTPDNIPPKDDYWNPFGYSTIADLIDELLKFKRDTLNNTVYDFISQYRTILRRYVVGNSEIEQICQKIYKKHSKALDLIFQHRPDIELEISDYLKNLLTSTEAIVFDSSIKTEIRFTSKILDSFFEKISEGWTKSKRIFLFNFCNYDRRLVLNLGIGPGPQEYREKIRDACMLNPSLFKLSGRKFYRKWHTVFQKKFLDRKDFEDTQSGNVVEFEVICSKIEKKWNDFLTNDLSKIEEHFQNNWS